MSHASRAKFLDYRMRLLTAVAAVAVVAGHVDPAGLSGPFGVVPPYSWQVAAFVFASGYFFRLSSAETPLTYLGRKAKRLLLPLFLINLVYGFVAWGLRTLGLPVGEPLSLRTLLIDPLVSGHAFALNGPMWFLSPLFFAEAVNVLVRRVLLWAGEAPRVEALVFVLYLACGVVAIKVGGPEGLPAGPQLFLARLGFFLSCLGMGRAYRMLFERFERRFPTVPYLLILLGIQLAVVAACKGQVVYNVAWCRFYHGPVPTLVATACSLAIMLRACRVLADGIGRSRLVARLADGSYSIMCHHLAGCFLLTLVVAVLAKAFGIPGDFDFAALAAQGPGYFYLPFGLHQFAAVYVIVGIAFSLGIHAAWNRIRPA